MQVEGGLYNTSWFLVINKDKWNKISAQDQAAIESVSGAAFARLAGKAWDDSDRQARKLLEDAGMEIHEANPKVLAAIKAAASKREADWIEAVAATGYDGASALKSLREMTGVAPK